MHSGSPFEGIFQRIVSRCVPIAILYNFFVDRFIAGFTVGAIK